VSPVTIVGDIHGYLINKSDNFTTFLTSLINMETRQISNFYSLGITWIVAPSAFRLSLFSSHINLNIRSQSTCWGEIINPGWWHPLSILEKNVLIYLSRPGQVQPDYLRWDNEPLRLAPSCGHCRSQIFCRPRRHLPKLLQFGIDPAVGPLSLGASEGRNLRFIMEWSMRWAHLEVEG
jgi:hypothetical protein